MNWPDITSKSRATLLQMSFDDLYSEIVKVLVVESGNKLFARIWLEADEHDSILTITKFEQRKRVHVVYYIFKSRSEADSFASFIYRKNPTDEYLKQLCCFIQ